MNYQKLTRKSIHCRKLKRMHVASAVQSKPPLKIMYDMWKEIEFKPKWYLVKTVREVLERDYEKQFTEAME